MDVSASIVIFLSANRLPGLRAELLRWIQGIMVRLAQLVPRFRIGERRSGACVPGMPWRDHSAVCGPGRVPALSRLCLKTFRQGPYTIPPISPDVVDVSS